MPAFIKSDTPPVSYSSVCSARSTDSSNMITRRVVWCPRTIKNSFNRSNSQVEAKFEVMDNVSQNILMNEAVLKLNDIGLRCMSKIPDWNPKINSLVSKFYQNRIRHASSHNFIVYEEAKLLSYKASLKAFPGVNIMDKNSTARRDEAESAAGGQDGLSSIFHSALPRPHSDTPKLTAAALASINNCYRNN